MIEITNNIPATSDEIDEEIRLAEKMAAELQVQIEEKRKRMAHLKAEQERRLNDPHERAKLFKNANDMIEAGVKEYEAKGYSCDVQFDEYGLLTKISFKLDKAGKNGKTEPRKKKGEEGFVPAMTTEQFAKIYPSLGNSFKNENIVELLVKEYGEGKYSNYRTQPILGNILKNGHQGISFTKVGSQGRGVSYTKNP